MSITLTWSQIAVRLVCAVVAGALIGINRTENGRAAGLRTSILVALAACIAMLQVNLLLPLAGRSPDSFVMNDLMRLPLGILSGMGFIGAGAILRRDNIVVGVTTAASMWFLTVIGLCLGGGQIALGLVGAVLGLLSLVGLKPIEDRMKLDHQGKLLIVTGAAGPGEDEIHAILKTGGFRISSSAFSAGSGANGYELSYDVHWRASPYVTKVPEAIRLLSARTGVVRIAWTPQAR